MAEAEETPTPGSPLLRDLIVKVVSACTDRKGISFYALKMALASEGYDYKLHYVKRAVMNLMRQGEIIQDHKCGLSGRFKAPKPEVISKKKAKERKARKSKEQKKKKEKEPRKPRKPRKPKDAVVVTLE